MMVQQVAESIEKAGTYFDDEGLCMGHLMMIKQEWNIVFLD